MEQLIGHGAQGRSGRRRSDQGQRHRAVRRRRHRCVPLSSRWWSISGRPGAAPAGSSAGCLKRWSRRAGAVNLTKIDIDQHPELAGQLKVQSIPAVFAFAGGRPVDWFHGRSCLRACKSAPLVPSCVIFRAHQRLSPPRVRWKPRSPCCRRRRGKRWTAGDLGPRLRRSLGMVLQHLKPDHAASLIGLARVLFGKPAKPSRPSERLRCSPKPNCNGRSMPRSPPASALDLAADSGRRRGPCGGSSRDAWRPSQRPSGAL